MINPTTYLTRLVVRIESLEEAETGLPWARFLASQFHIPLSFVYVSDQEEDRIQGVPADLSGIMASDYLEMLVSSPTYKRLDATGTVLVGREAEELRIFLERQPGSLLLTVRSKDQEDSLPTLYENLTTTFMVIPIGAPVPQSINSIVVGSDGSELSNNVLATSQAVSHSLNVAAIAVEAIEPGPDENDTYARLQPIIESRHIRVRGLASQTLQAAAQAFDSAMIVVGAHGAGEASPQAVGRTAAWLAQHSTRPVVIVPSVRQPANVDE